MKPPSQAAPCDLPTPGDAPYRGHTRRAAQWEPLGRKGVFQDADLWVRTPPWRAAKRSRRSRRRQEPEAAGAIASAQAGAARVRAEPVVALLMIGVRRSPSGTAVRERVSARMSPRARNGLIARPRDSGRTAVLISARKRTPPPCRYGSVPPRAPSSADGAAA